MFTLYSWRVVRFLGVGFMLTYGKSTLIFIKDEIYWSEKKQTLGELVAVAAASFFLRRGVEFFV